MGLACSQLQFSLHISGVRCFAKSRKQPPRGKLHCCNIFSFGDNQRQRPIMSRILQINDDTLATFLFFGGMSLGRV